MVPISPLKVERSRIFNFGEDKMKKLFTLLLAFPLVFTLVACGGNDQGEKAPEENQEVVENNETEEKGGEEPVETGEKTRLDEIIESGGK